ncbi:MAG: cytochrome c oxidase assembly protein [Hyphomicrobiales bacterium]|nr:cytochrome c oxidase assembly protein [Hyphomicrobiales bacterium]MBV8827115.1 cytochrome c oxidase assembly protein [Hyphomicrobiales bacterium]MBV9426716.1 cytochrome c oxidase assembly protein [Bradyrhizobiaceae bacterium]
MSGSELPYCGAPPVPGSVVWNTDPILAAVLIACAALYAIGVRRKPVGYREQALFWSGWLLTALALVSPLCNLSVALFSARIGQHVILTTLAAPLLVLGRVERVFSVLPSSRSRDEFAFGAIGHALAVVVFAIVMWAWHVPALYDLTFRSTLVYWTMHATFIGAALLLWFAALRSADSIGTIFAALIATMLQMSLLGAWLTFAGRPLFAAHADTTLPWGFSQLQDQQLGGLIMWVIGGFFLTAGALVVLADYLLRESGPVVRRVSL